MTTNRHVRTYLAEKYFHCLSGGQKQRLSLARALLRKPRLLLLDEATAALDAESHRAVQDAIDSLTDVTILEVAHRLSSTRTADNILVMDAGVIIQQGTYDELASINGKFRDLLASSQEDQLGSRAA